MSYSEARPYNGAEIDVRTAALVIAGISFAALAGAWAFQLGGYAPCSLCLDERIPYYAAVPGGLAAAFLARSLPRLAALILAALALAFLWNAGLSIYHAGAEWHFWAGPETCTGSVAGPTSLSQALKHNNAVRCDVAALRILGISLAGYNALLSAALAAAGGLAAWRGLRSA